jgi:hypothetical protein
MTFCETDEHFEKYAKFMIHNRKEMNLNIKNLISALCNHFSDGKIIIVLNEHQDVIASAVYFIGTPENNFKDNEIALLDSTILLEEYRTSFIFIKGLKKITNDIQQTKGKVKDVRLLVEKNNIYLNRLYGKFAEIQGERDNVLIYSTSLEKLVNFIKMFEKRIP